MPVYVAVAAERRQENYKRRAAFSGEPVHKHLRLTDDQFRDISVEYHGWRVLIGGINRGLQDTSEKRMQTFLLYLASGGYHFPQQYLLFRKAFLYY